MSLKLSERCDRMTMGFIIFLIVFAVCFVGIFMKIDTMKTNNTVLRTKILTSNPRHTGRMNGMFYIETTFMVYYKDGTHKAKTIKNGTPEYDLYMSKLEA